MLTVSNMHWYDWCYVVAFLLVFALLVVTYWYDHEDCEHEASASGKVRPTRP